MPVEPSRNLALTPGTQAALFSVLSARVAPGDRVAVFDPDYPFTARMLRFLGADIGYVPTRLVDGCYEPDLDALETEFATRGARHLVFSHPNNPTGAVFSAAIVEEIAALAIRHDVSVVVDELYCRLIHEAVPFFHLAARDGMFDRTATLLGPSKTESLSGYRLGVLVGGEALMRSVENVLSITALRAPAYAQHLLPHWLGPDEAWLQDRLAEFYDRAGAGGAAMAQARAAIRDGLSVAGRLGAGLPDAEVAHALLAEAGELISPGYQFGPRANGHFRLCYARDERSWKAKLEQITETLDGLARRRCVA